MNLIILMGRTTKDIELRYTQNTNTAVARFSLAVDRPYRKQGEEQQTDFIPCVAFGKTAEKISKYISKGRRIAIEGRIQIDSYNKDDGSKGYSTSIVVERFYFADSKPGEQAQEINRPKTEPEQDFYAGFNDNDDDLPF
jgi:single-strand DNA-binding protein